MAHQLVGGMVQGQGQGPFFFAHLGQRMDTSFQPPPPPPLEVQPWQRSSNNPLIPSQLTSLTLRCHPDLAHPLAAVTLPPTA